MMTLLRIGRGLAIIVAWTALAASLIVVGVLLRWAAQMSGN
jgi:hypothetical protein